MCVLRGSVLQQHTLYDIEYPFGRAMIVVAVVVSMCLACLVWIQLARSVAILISHSESMRV